MAQKYKSNSKSAQFDQFYTNEKIAKTVIDGVIKIINKNNRKIFVEPSAGSGSFSDILIEYKEECICYDIDPKKDYIIKKDFFEIGPKDIGKFSTNDICVIGNPPFGKNSSLAVKFFNHSATLADTICFIVPRTFNKQSIHNRLDLYFRVKKSILLPKNSFIFNDEPYDVPCVFQIWQRSKTKRKIIKSKNKCILFEFVKKDKADFAVRRAGGRSGTAFLDIKDFSTESNHFCKIIGNKSAKEVVDFINTINFSQVANATAGVRSVSKGELIRAVERKLLYVSKNRS